MQKGKVGLDKRMGRYYVSWYDATTKKSYKIWFYEGVKMYDRNHALHLLGCMRSDYKRGVSLNDYRREVLERLRN